MDHSPRCEVRTDRKRDWGPAFPGRLGFRSRTGGLLAGVAALAFCATAAHAQTTNWTAANNTGDWFDSGNWDNGVPSGSTNAFIDTLVSGAHIDGAAASTNGVVVIGILAGNSGALTIRDGGTLSDTREAVTFTLSLKGFTAAFSRLRELRG
jgi:hypothetical protein